ncbi:MAG: transglutaminase-like domain-containing protein [Pirellula sp.]|nr:transglutaminase-like domain-containing protein [Pirellula sp.]
MTRPRWVLANVCASCICVMLAGCDHSQPDQKRSSELLMGLSQQNADSAKPDEKTIAAQAEKLLSNKKSVVGEESADTTQATPKADDPILVIDSVPDKQQQSLPVEDDTKSPWMFDGSTPLVTWEVTYRANIPVGYTSKKSVSSNRGGESVINTDFRSVSRYAKDGKEQRRELVISLIERPNGELISLTSRSQTGTDDQTFIVRVDGTRALLELTINKAKQQKEVEWDNTVRGPFAIEQSMMRKPMKDSESRLVKLLDPFSGRILEARLDAQSKYKSPIMLGKAKLLRETKVTTRDGESLSESTLWSDEDGVILKSYIPFGDLRNFQVDDETYKEVESVFDLMFAENQSVELVIKPGKREAFINAIDNEDQITYRFQQQKTDPYKNLSNRCNQRKKSLDAFTSEITVFRLKNRDELPAGVESVDKPETEDLELTGWLDSNSPVFDSLYADLLPQVANEDVHVKVLLMAKRVSERYESVGFNNDVRKLSVGLSKNRLNSVEQSMALVALLRKDKIPARLVLGYVFDRNASEPAMIFQAWVEYHYNDWWWPIDPINPTKTGLLDRIKLKELNRFSSDVRRVIMQVLEFGNDGTVTYQD